MPAVYPTGYSPTIMGYGDIRHIAVYCPRAMRRTEKYNKTQKKNQVNTYINDVILGASTQLAGMNKGNRSHILLARLSLVSLVIYFGFRIYIYSSQSLGIFSIFFAVLLLLAEGHSILQSFGFLASIIRLGKPNARRIRSIHLNKRNLPTVTVLVPARNEPLNILEQTFICLVSLDYTKKDIYFLDGSDQELQEKNRELAEKYNINYFAPQRPSKNKAEIINKILPEITSKYISVFDADQNPMPEFLMETVAIAEYSKNIAFVQTPQLYTNIDTGPIAKSAALQQSIFFENICEGKGTSNAMFCCGTNYLMRTNVLREVGGFDEVSVTEDFSTSVLIHARGYRSIYYNHVRVFGMAPQTLSAYFKQQNRWSAGTIGAVRKLIILSLQGKLHLKPVQLWEYFLSATYYITGWSFFILMICPALFLLFDIPSYFANPYLYLGTFVPYYVLTLTTFYATMKGRDYSYKDIFIGTTMTSITFPILMQSTLSGLFNKKISFQITDKGHGEKLAFFSLWPWIALMILNLFAIGNGIIRFPENPYAMGINIFWCFYHLVLMAQIFKLNKKPIIKEKSILKYT